MKPLVNDALTTPRDGAILYASPPPHTLSLLQLIMVKNDASIILCKSRFFIHCVYPNDNT